MKLKRRKKQHRHPKPVARRPPPGSSPGTLLAREGNEPVLRVIGYSEEELHDQTFASLQEAKNWLDQHRHLNLWFQVTGLGDTGFLKELREMFKIHPLELEDAITVVFRPKLDRHKDHTFSIHRVLFYNPENELQDEQLSLFLYPGFILSLQERPIGCLNPLRERMNVEGTLIRKSSVFYLYYAIVDSVIDNYFPVLERVEDRLDALEEDVYDNPRREYLSDIQYIRRDLLVLRKNIIAEKDDMSELIRNLNAEEKEHFGIFLQDAWEHCIQILDLIESQKEIAFTLIDIYLSSINNRLSEVMKVLTIISSIFIPMTFVASIYGMNFSPHNLNGDLLPSNMPELYHPWGYLFALGAMLLIGIVQVIFFKRKGWL